MFEMNQEAFLFLHSLVSAAKPHGGSLFKQKETDNALNIVNNSVKIISRYLLFGVKDASEAVRIQLKINQRLHAAVFFTTLRSHGIISNAANSFYGSISFGWPTVDFKFYIELNFKNDWSDYFIRCASQLPSKVLVTLLNNILNIPFSNRIKYYSWHLILQTVIFKLLKVDVDNEREYPFCFDFCIEPTSSATEILDNSHVEQSEIAVDACNLVVDKLHGNLSSYEDLFNILFGSLCRDMQHSCDIDIIKVILNAAKTIMKFKEGLCDENLIKIFKLLGDCLALNTNVKILKAALNNYAHKFVSHVYATSAWNISESYLLLLINYYYSALLPEETLNFKNKLECIQPYRFFPVLQDLDPFSREDFYVHNEKHLRLLYIVIQQKYEGASFAAKILISNPLLLQKESTLKILEENWHIIDIIDVHQLLLRNVQKVELQQKMRLLQLLYKSLVESPIKIYNDALKYILFSYGYTEEFKLPGFEEKLALFVKGDISANEIENVLPTLFLQSPKTTLKCVISEALNRGTNGESLIQTLKFVPEACIYRKTSEDTTPLNEILRNYIEQEELKSHELKHFETLLQFLMEVHVETPILCVDEFIEKCVIPYLKCSNKTGLLINCLNVVAKKLVDKEVTLNQKYLSSSDSCVSLLNRDFDISSVTLKNVVSALTLLLNTCIENGSASFKNLIASSLSTLEDYQIHSGILNDDDKEELQEHFDLLNEVVRIYGKEFLPSSPDFSEFKNLASFWIWTCKTKNIAAFAEKYLKETFTYVDLLNMLIQNMPHFTADEWKFSVSLVKALCKNASFCENVVQCPDIPFNLSENEKKLYIVINCFASSLQFAMQRKVEELVYPCACFCNCLKQLLEEEALSSQMLLAVFLEVCYLMSGATLSLYSTLSSALFELKNRLLLCAEKKSVALLQKLFVHAMKCLPDSPEKNILSQKITKID